MKSDARVMEPYRMSICLDNDKTHALPPDMGPFEILFVFPLSGRDEKLLNSHWLYPHSDISRAEAELPPSIIKKGGAFIVRIYFCGLPSHSFRCSYRACINAKLCGYLSARVQKGLQP
jgi:hypothetical protein